MKLTISKKSNSNNANIYGILILTATALSAWLPSTFGGYLIFADDHLILQWHDRGIVSLYHEQGVWRIAGFVFYGVVLKYLQNLTPILILIFHIMTCILFFLTCKRLLMCEPIALLGAMIFAVSPGASQCLLWAGAAPLVIATGNFWALIYILCTYKSNKVNKNVAVIVTLFLVLIGNCFQENLLFSLAISGFLVLIPKKDESFKSALACNKDKLLAFCPLIGSAVFALLFQLTRNPNSIKSVSINLKSIVSTYVHQYNNAIPFYVWSDSWYLENCLDTIGVFGIILSVIVLILTVIFTTIFKSVVLNWDKNNSDFINFSVKGMLVYIFLLLFGGSLIYAFAGGHSLDNRKNYPLIPIIILLIGFAFDRSRTTWKPTYKMHAILPISCFVVCIITCWVNVSLWRFFVISYENFIKKADKEKIVGQVKVVYHKQPPLNWEHFMTIYNPAGLSNGTEVRLDENRSVFIWRDVDAPVMTFNCVILEWEILK